ncbi:MAG: hypothetical protein NC489_44475, partial [Ruminococcus flavefaciens]|nr:hypothetical protein [Ruminococcus flavefaciens]
MKNEGNKKLLNVRLPVLLACALVAGITAGCLFVFFNVSLFWIIAVIPVAAVIFILFAVFGKRNYWLIAVILCSSLVIL